MAAPSRVAGTLSLSVDGVPRTVRASLEVQPLNTKRESIANLDGTISFKEMPIAPYIKFDMEVGQGTSLKSLGALQNSTVVASLANGQTYILSGAFFEGDLTLDAAEGKASGQVTGQQMLVA
jgi:hypothetical protein